MGRNRTLGSVYFRSNFVRSAIGASRPLSVIRKRQPKACWPRLPKIRGWHGDASTRTGRDRRRRKAGAAIPPAYFCTTEINLMVVLPTFITTSESGASQTAVPVLRSYLVFLPSDNVRSNDPPLMK